MKEKRRARHTDAVFFVLTFLVAGGMCISGCGSRKDTEGRMAVTALPKVLGAAGEEARFLTEAEIELAYPFLQGLEDYRLVCRPALPEIRAYLSGAAAGGQEEAGAGPDEYELWLHNGEGELLQRLPCGRITEDTEFRFDDLSFEYGIELEIFTPDETGKVQSGLLFAWNYAEDMFFTEPEAIPVYQEV